MNRLQPITRNLPGVIRDPIEALLGPECYTALVWDTDLGSTACVKLALSKVLGLGIVAGGAVVKVPQILTVLEHKSARGLSLSSYVLDTAATAITVAYNLRNHFPYSTYGEMVFLLVQNAILITLITAYTPGPTLARLVPIACAFATFSYALSSPTVVPASVLATLQTLTIPLALTSKVPQIVTNARARSTGQLSAFLVFNSLAGCLARVYTASTETSDPVLVVGFAAAAVLNAVLAVQFWAYRRNRRATGEPVPVEQEKATTTTMYDGVGIGRPSVTGGGGGGQGGQGTPVRKSTPSRTSSPASARYVRKLD
ncbi:hypothetical protein JCM11491_003026 [Sporobolomyces phaffii]